MATLDFIFFFCEMQIIKVTSLKCLCVCVCVWINWKSIHKINWLHENLSQIFSFIL